MFAEAQPFAGQHLGVLGIAIAFGLSIIAMAFVIGNVSGCHINPAVSLGMFIDRRLSGKDLIGYWIAQFVGGILAAALLLFIIGGAANLGGIAETGLGANGFGEASATGINIVVAFVVEVVLTCVFVLAVLGSTASEKTAPFAGIIIGLTLTFVHILGIQLTGTSVNPARSLGPALLMIPESTVAISQVWLFIVAPLVGAVLAALPWKIFKPKASKETA